MSSSSIYFSIDYRSPPAGMGQIVTPGAPDVVDGKYNMILVDTVPVVDRQSAQPSPFYVETRTFLTQDDWLNLDELDQLYDYLVSQGVETVYDSELAYDFPDRFDENGHIPLANWIETIKECSSHWMIG